MSAPNQAPPPQGLSTYETMIYQQQQARKAAEQQAARDRATQDIAEAQAQFRKDQAAASSRGETLTSQTYTKEQGGPTTIESNYERTQLPQGAGRSVGTVNGSYIDLTPQNVVDYQEARRTQFNAHEQAKTEGQANQDYYNAPVLGSLSRLDVMRSQQAEANRLSPYSYSKHYSVNLDDSFSGIIPGKMRYQVNLEDRLSGGPYRYERQPGNTGQPKAEPFKLEGGFDENFANYFSNLIELPKAAYQWTQTGKFNPSLKPEVEGQAYSALSSGQSSSIKGGFSLINPTSVRGLGDIGAAIIKNPLGAAGSLAGTALTFGITSGVSSVGKVARAGLAARSTRSFEAEVLPQLRETGKTVAGVEKGVLGIGKEGEAFRFNVAAAPQVSRTGKVTREYFHSSPLSKVEKGDLLSGDSSRLTAYYQRVVKIGENEYPLSAIRQKPSKASEQAIPLLSGNPKDAYEPLRSIKQVGSERIEIPAAKGLDTSKLPIYDKVVATSETLSDKEVKALVKPDAGRNFLGLGDDLTKDIFRIEARPGKPSTPFNFGSSQDVITKETLKGLGIDVSKSTSAGGSGIIGSIVKDITPARAAGFGLAKQRTGNSTSFGFGGATGAERKARKSSDIYESNYESFAIPKGESMLSDLVKSVQQTKPSMAAAQKNPFATNLKIESLLGETQKGRSSQGSILGDLGKVATAGLFSSTATKQAFKYEFPWQQVTDQPNIPKRLFDLGYSPKREDRKGKKKKGRNYGRTFKSTNPLSAVVGSKTKLGKAIQKFGDLT